MSRWESPTFNSCLVNNSLKVEFLPFGVGSAPQGGTQHFSHHAFAITGAEVPAWSREHAWRFSYFFDHGGAAATNKLIDGQKKQLSAEEKKKKEEDAHKAWLAFVEKEAPKRLANRKPLPNDPSAYKEVKVGQPMPEDKFEAWKKEKEQIMLKAKQDEESEMAKIRQDVDKMMEKRTKTNNMTQQVTASGKKKAPSNKQKALQEQLLLLKKQNNPLAQKVRLRLPKVDKNKEVRKSLKSTDDNQLSSSANSSFTETMKASSTHQIKSENEGEQSRQQPPSSSSQLARSGASIVSSTGSNGSLSPSSNRTHSSNTSSLAYPPNLLNMANLAAVTRDPTRTPTATAAKALVLEEALDSYIERKNKNRNSGMNRANSVNSSSRKMNQNKARQEWDGRFSVAPEAEKPKRKDTDKKDNNNKQRIPVFASTMPPPKKNHSKTSLSLQHAKNKDFSLNQSHDLTAASSSNSKHHQEEEGGGGIVTLDAGITPTTGESPPWSGFRGERDGGDGSGDGVKTDPWDYQDHFASIPQT